MAKANGHPDKAPAPHKAHAAAAKEHDASAKEHERAAHALDESAKELRASADEHDASAKEHDASAKELRAAAKEHEAAGKKLDPHPHKAPAHHAPKKDHDTDHDDAHAKKDPAHAKDAKTARPASEKDGKPEKAAKPARKKLRHRVRAVVVERRWPWISAIVVAVLLVAAFVLYRHHQAAEKAAHPPAAPPVAITSEAARKGDIGITVTAIGTVTPLQSVSITARVPGQILRVDYKEGMVVHKGDSLLQIDPQPYEAALEQARGALAHDQAVLNEARIDLQRYRDALKLNAVARQQVEDQAQLVLQDEGTVKTDQGTVDNAALNLAYCHIRAPFDGRTGLRLVDPGNIIQSGSTTPLVTIAQLQPITVIFSIAEDYLPQIEGPLQNHESLPVYALDRTEEKQLAAGTLVALDNMVDTTTGTVRLRAQFDNTDGALFPNQFVNARILVKTIHDATLVPSAAVQRNTQGAFMYVIENGKASLRTVKADTSQGNDTQVEGINPGEVVATSGFNKLKDGVTVTSAQGGKDGSNEGGKDRASSTDGGTKAAGGAGSPP